MGTEERLKTLEKIKQMIKQDPLLIPLVLNSCAVNLHEFQVAAKKQNDRDLREALGDAVHIIGMPRRPNKNTLSHLCLRIKDAIFKDGITSYHHEGEKQFYRRVIEGKDQ